MNELGIPLKLVKWFEILNKFPAEGFRESKKPPENVFFQKEWVFRAA